MIRLVYGLNGHGKSLYSSWLAATTPLPFIVTNIQFSVRMPQINKVRLLENGEVCCEKCGHGFFAPDFWRPGMHVPRSWANRIADAEIIIDEADLYFPATDWQRLLPFLVWLKQQRKRGSNVTFVTQHPSMIFNRIRQLAGEWVHCRRDQKDELPWQVRYFWPTSWLPWRRIVSLDEGQTIITRVETLDYHQAKYIFPFYDTTSELDVGTCPDDRECLARFNTRRTRSSNRAATL